MAKEGNPPTCAHVCTTRTEGGYPNKSTQPVYNDLTAWWFKSPQIQRSLEMSLSFRFMKRVEKGSLATKAIWIELTEQFNGNGQRSLNQNQKLPIGSASGVHRLHASSLIFRDNQPRGLQGSLIQKNFRQEALGLERVQTQLPQGHLSVSISAKVRREH